MIYTFLIGLHVLICITLILVVLLQSGKGGGLAGAFGGMGGAGQSLFGGRGAATFLSKATTVLGIAFMASSLILALMSRSNTPQSVLRSGQAPAPGTAPPATSEPLQIPGSESLSLPPLEESGDPAVAPPTGEGTPPTGQEAAPAQEPAGNDAGGTPDDN